MALRVEELAKTIDLTLLDPSADPEEVSRLCADAVEYHVASVCVLPECVPQVVELLRGADVKVCAVVGYPDGSVDSREKVRSADRAVGEGAQELEVVMNLGAMQSGDFRLVRDELAAVLRRVRMRSVNAGRGVVLAKAVLECRHLDDKRKRFACKIIEVVGLDFAVTSTGRDSAATVQEVELLRDCLPEGVGVKASGGVECALHMQTMLSAGAGRIGVMDAAAITRTTVGEPV